MKCPNCQHENPSGSLFCGKCGEKLSLICPQCSSENFPGNNFCNRCGFNLTQPSEPPPKELSFDEKIRKIQKYLPKGLTDKILSQRDRIEGEKKQVTVMFCDMEGFTPLVEKLGPEEAYAIMDQIYELLIHKVHDYEGTVNEMTGDGIVALFGAPIALEDAPQRAIRSAHAIHREMVRFSDKIKQEREGIPSLKMRIGIHTGPVVVGTLGNDLRVEFKAVGDTVNLASRMEDLAEPGATYVTEDTFKLTEGFFRYESLGEKEVKGKEELVKTYRVIGPSTRRTRFDVSAERGLTPFVGRDRELELILDGFERAKEGRGQAFSIIAEAGVGKSRFSYEFIKSMANENVTILEGKCLSYSRGIAYHPIIDLFKSNFDIRESDEDYQIKDKVVRGLKQLDVDEASTLPYLLELLSVKDSGFDQIPLSQEGKKDRMIETIIRIPLKGSEIRPLIMVIEDLHWMDKTSEEALKYLLESISGARILLIFTYRHEFVHTWGGRSYHNQVNLNRLSNRESLAMVNHLLGTDNIESDLEYLILEKTEGVPFFIEEFLKSFKDLNVIERKDNRYHLTKDIQDLAIPSTIQDVIMARVDSLPEGTKEVLQTGSVIEREFTYELIKRVTGLPERELLSYLSVLKDSELLYERGIFPDSAYIFKHALTREVVYDSILTKNREKLHDQIGQTIEELFRDNIEGSFEILVEHYIRGQNYAKSAEYSRLAARQAQKQSTFETAISYASKCVDCLEKLPKTNDVQTGIIDARTVLGLYNMQQNYHVEGKEAIDPIVDLAVKQGYMRRLAQIYLILGSYNAVVKEDVNTGFKEMEKSVKISYEVNDFATLSIANFFLGDMYGANCEFEKALLALETAFNISKAAKSLWGMSQIKSAMGFYVYFNQGRIDLSYQTCETAVQMAEESGAIHSKAHAYTTLGASSYGKRYLQEAEEHLLKGMTFCKRINHYAYDAFAQMYLGEIYTEIGEYQKAEDHYCQAICLLEQQSSMPSVVNHLKICAARAKALNNEKDMDLESLTGYVTENNQKAYQGHNQRYIGEILLKIDEQQVSMAEDWVKKAIEADNQNGTMWHLGQDYALYAELFKRKGDLSKAKENLNKAIEILKECGADGWVDKYEKELASL